MTIGNFDGVHTGHRVVLAEVVTLARRRGIRSVAVTFDLTRVSSILWTSFERGSGTKW